ncbi:alpha/beta hydrolase [Tritonibacter scottomollicae]|uniref:alpha/beta hydrolase n=1 Tax=Tritonibacter scottomollicae TaxID=483013 RepID=UPI003AA88DA6
MNRENSTPTGMSKFDVVNGSMDEAVLFSDIASGPDEGFACWITTEDGVRLRIGVWNVGNATNGTIFLFPGRTEYIEIYGQTASDLADLGYSTFVIDWRGQGLSDRDTKNAMTGHVNSFLDYQNDVDAMVKAATELELPKPWNLLAHSMGACIGIRALSRRLPISACAFSAPMFDIHLSKIERTAAWPLTWAACLMGRAHSFAPGYSGNSYVLSHDFEGNRLTTDADMYQYCVDQASTHGELLLGGPSMGWLFEALKETKTLKRMSSPDIPCICFCGDQDHIVDISAIESRLVEWKKGEFQMIEGVKHELLFETPETRNVILSSMDCLFKKGIVG